MNIGTIDKEAVRRVVRANIKEIQFCYERQLQGNKSLEGKVLIEWEIGAQGAVLTTKLLKTSVSNAAVENCVMTRIKSWKFPEPPPNTVAVVQYPFNFVNNTR
jgi:TonB family protein